MKYILVLIIMNIAVMQELQVEGDLTVSGEINSSIIESLQNEISILNGLVDSLLNIQSITETVFLEVEIELLTSLGGSWGEDSYIDISDLTDSQNNFFKVHLLSVTNNSGWGGLEFLCENPYNSFGDITYGSNGVSQGSGRLFILSGESPSIRFHSSYTTGGFETLSLLIEKI
jgi:hypothetical protein